VKKVVIVLMVTALAALGVTPAHARRITVFEKQVLQEERYHRQLEKEWEQEDQQDEQARAFERKKRQQEEKTRRVQNKRAVYNYSVDEDLDDNVDDDLGRDRDKD
jgi:hypothetical protein